MDLAVRELRRIPSVKTVILIGSQSRGDASSHSDIDLLIIGNELDHLEDLSFSLFDKSSRHVSLIAYPHRQFSGMYFEGSLFVAHVISEGQVLYDDGYFTALKQNGFRLSKELVSFQWKVLKQRMNLFDDLSCYGRNFAECLSQLFPLAKNVAIIVSASKGQPIFNKEMALDKLSVYYPALEDDVEDIRNLRAFSLLWRNGKHIPLPFTPFDCRDKVEYYRNKLKNIIDTVDADEWNQRNSGLTV